MFHARHSLANSLRAPYFHNGSAATLLDAVNFCDARFNLLLSHKDKKTYLAFWQPCREIPKETQVRAMPTILFNASCLEKEKT